MTYFSHAIGAFRVGFVDGGVIINPTRYELEKSQLDLVVTSTIDSKVGKIYFQFSSPRVVRYAPTCKIKYMYLFYSYAGSICRNSAQGDLSVGCGKGC